MSRRMYIRAQRFVVRIILFCLTATIYRASGSSETKTSCLATGDCASGSFCNSTNICLSCTTCSCEDTATNCHLTCDTYQALTLTTFFIFTAVPARIQLTTKRHGDEHESVGSSFCKSRNNCVNENGEWSPRT